MADTTHIAWSNSSWNPFYGCTKISPGCKFCYMYRDMERYGRDPKVVTRSKTTFHDPLKWKEPRMVFTCSWSDFFIEAADAWRDEVWDIIRRTPHTYQILTKRPELIPDRLPKDWGEGYPNVWLGVSIEGPEYLFRATELRKIAAKVRFLSLEPLLGAIPDLDLSGISWGIVGGESGSLLKRRDCNLVWITNLVDQFLAANVPIFVKQDSGSKAGQQGRIPDEYWIHQFPSSDGAKSEAPNAEPG